jgi:hypothetical protein
MPVSKVRHDHPEERPRPRNANAECLRQRREEERGVGDAGKNDSSRITR